MSNYIHALDTANKRVKAVNCDSNGNLQVDIVSSSAGGDATAANQVIVHNKLDTIDGSINVIENCVSAGELAVAHNGLTELDSAINSQKLDVNIASDSSSLATSGNQVTSNTHLATIAGDTTEMALSHYAEGDSVGVSDTGVLIMGRNGSNTAKPIHITNNGDIEVEIADMVKGQALMASSFPVVISSNQSALDVTLDTANTTKISNIEDNTNKTKPDRSQTTLASSQAIASGSNTSEIDMDGYNHLTIYGDSSVNFGSWCLVRRATSAGTDYLDGGNIFSANDPTGGSNYYIAVKFENVGSRYVALRNLDASSQTVNLYAERTR